MIRVYMYNLKESLEMRESGLPPLPLCRCAVADDDDDASAAHRRFRSSSDVMTSLPENSLQDTPGLQGLFESLSPQLAGLTLESESWQGKSM